MAGMWATGDEAARLAARGYELAQVGHQFGQLITAYRALFEQLGRQGLGESEFVAKADRATLARLEVVLEEEIRPEERAVWAAFAGLFGFAWGDCVRVAHPSHPPADLEPSGLQFNPPSAGPFALLQGRALRRDGRPGSRTAQAYLQPGVTQVTVLSSAAGRG
jgi:hypothetical protein